MFKNIFNTPESLRNAILQAVRSGVESLRTVLANNPSESNISGNSSRSGGASYYYESQQDPGRSRSDSSSSISSTTTAMPGTGAGAGAASSSRPPMPVRDRTSGSGSGSGSWPFLPPSLTSARHLQQNSNASTNSNISSSSSSGSNAYIHTITTTTASDTDTTASTSANYQQRPGSIKDVAGSITDSVAESIKSLGNAGLKLGQLADLGFGLRNGSSVSIASSISSASGLTPHIRRGTGDSSSHHHHQHHHLHPYLVGAGPASRSRVWTWNGQDADNGDGDESLNKEMLLRTGARTEEAAKETATLLARLREQQQEQDFAMERARRMPEVEKMAQRYQDSWTDIHNHTTRNSEKADDADEILEKVMELCMRHIRASTTLAEETKGFKELEKSLSNMATMAENIQRNLEGLESKIEKLEEDADILNLADWKKSKTVELDKYMESKRKELWDKAELLSLRSEQYQKEEAARKLLQYQNQFETDMAHFRRTQEEQVQELWKIAEADGATAAIVAGEASGSLNNQRATSSSPAPGTPLARRSGVQGGTLIHPEADRRAIEDEEAREKEDLDQFLGPATESDSREDDNGDDQSVDEDDDENDVGDESEEEEEEEEEETSEDEEDDDLDPIAKARKARAAAAAAAAASVSTAGSTGSTISAFSALANQLSTTSLPRP
ncbi:hypothetical protein BGZ99_009194 [Dissophora globulifera]|uniref:Uncharacterized protein n=1 Tax=Dissophora globulifera TaxID=979702 RepID=A0A9P6R7Y1_9FUNG|nr:hypothetical protein BGZ99_009194 [Dissophora globulifera]